MSDKIIFLDNHSTTPIDPRVLEVMNEAYLNDYANPSSVDHDLGVHAMQRVKEAAKQVGELLNVNYQNVLFTSGATESINLAIKGRVKRIMEKKDHIKILISPIEHSAVLSCCESLKIESIEIEYLHVDENGCLDLNEINQKCKNGNDLLCVMSVNNEIGNIYPIAEIAETANKYGVEYICDATQGVGKTLIDFDGMGIDYMALSGHKIYGPKGVGVLIMRDKNNLYPLLHGGDQQYGLRAGTLNLPGIVGLGKSCELRRLEWKDDEKKILRLKNILLDEIMKRLKDVVVIGDKKSKISGNLSLAIKGVNNKTVTSFIRDRLAISTGAACSAGVIAESKVLIQMGVDMDLIKGFFRFCVGKFNTEDEIGFAASYFCEVISKIKRIQI